MTATAIPFRGVKLNLPENSYRVHPSLTRHREVMQTPEFWRRLLGFLGGAGFNALTLWSIHPWSLMVRPPEWPEACPFDDEELERRQSLWRLIFAAGRANGIRVIPVCFNIFVSPELARARGLAAYSADLSTGYNGEGDYSDEVREYNRAILTQVLETYPDLGGIGVSQNERMEGRTLEEWQQWIADTYFDIAERYLQEKTFIVRAHTRPKPEMTRAAIESYPGTLPPQTLVDVKFNWSHGHATPEFHYMHEGASDAPLRDPVPDRYRLIYTVRNEDFFGLDYGGTSFMRALVEANRSPATAGYIVGSECLIPAGEYIVRPHARAADRGWSYLFERQPMFWYGWGTILSDPTADTAKVADRLTNLSGARGSTGAAYADAHSLLEAADLASGAANAIASSIASTWDFTHYTEGMIKGVRQDWFGQPFDPSSPLISVAELADARPLPPDWPTIRAWVDSGEAPEPGSPLARSATLRADSNRALDVLESLGSRAPASQLDAYERASARAWAQLGLCFAARLEAAAALCRGDDAADELMRALQRGYEEYRVLCETLDPWIPEPYELLHLGDNFTSQEFESGMALFHHREVLRLLAEEMERMAGTVER